MRAHLRNLRTAVIIPGISLLLLFVSRNQAAAQHLLQAFEFADLRNQTIFDITTDSKNDVYITGEFDGTIDFNPDTNAADTFFLRFELATNPRKQAVFVAKYSSTGKFRWAFMMAGYSSFVDQAKAICYDGFGHIYVAGQIKSADMDPSSGTAMFTDRGSFLVKYDTLGNYKWGVHYIGPGEGLDIDVDASGSVYFTGVFSGTIDVDAGPAVYNLSATGLGTYLVKYDSAGNLKKALVLTNAFEITGNGVEVDQNNNVFLAGTFTGLLDVDPSAATATISANGASDMFLVKYDSAWNYLWSISPGDDFIYEYGNCIAVDNSGNIWLGGEFVDSIDMASSGTPMYIPSAGERDAVIAKYSPDGDLITAFNIGGAYTEVPYAFDIDNGGSLYIAGISGYGCDYDPSSSTFQVPQTSSTNCFFGKYSPEGNFTWAYAFGGISSDYAYSIKCAGPAVWVGGNMNQTGGFLADLDPSSTIFELPAQGGSDIFLAKYDTLAGSIGIEDIEEEIAFTLAPNPARNNFRITNLNQRGITELEIYNVVGERIYRTEFREQHTTISIENLQPGIYVVRLKNPEASGQQLLLIQ